MIWKILWWATWIVLMYALNKIARRKQVDEYPTEEELEFIKNYKFDAQRRFLPLIEHLQKLWHWPDYAKWDGKILELHTGGWSGNEDIIEALEGTDFWLLCWKESKRGGHYKFEVTR